MIGAIIGDIAGSTYEFHSIKTKDFPLFAPGSNTTDDSLMSIAVASALMQTGESHDGFKSHAVTSMRQIATKYPCPMGGYDVSRESKAAKAALKQEWLNTWCGLCNEQNIVIIDAESVLYSAINQMVAKEMPSPGWFYLVAMELLLFTPYTQLSENDGKKYSKLSLCSQYETEVFIERQTSISAKEIDSLRKAYRESFDYLNNKTKKAVSAAASIIAITAASGGVAWILAPQIAVALGGSAFAGLHGIALVNASLAALGGGSLAAGGLGVAGGTAIIASGGALLGVAGSGTASLTAMALLTSKGFAVQECAKLLAYCSFSIKAGLMDHQALKDIRMALLDGIAMMKQQIEQQNPSKDARKAYDNSFKYLERCSSKLEKLAKKNERHQHKPSFQDQRKKTM